MSVSTFISDPEPEPPADFEAFYHRGYGKAWVNEAELPIVRAQEKNRARRAWERFLNAVQWHSEREPSERQPQEQPEVIAQEELAPTLQLIPGGKGKRPQGGFQNMTGALRRGTARTGIAFSIFTLGQSLEALKDDDSPPDLRDLYAQFQALEPLFRDIAQRADFRDDH